MEILYKKKKKLGIKSSYNPATTLLGIYPEETKIEKDKKKKTKLKKTNAPQCSL